MKKRMFKILGGSIIALLMVVNFAFGKERTNVNVNSKSVVTNAVAQSEHGEGSTVGGAYVCTCPKASSDCYCRF